MLRRLAARSGVRRFLQSPLCPAPRLPSAFAALHTQTAPQRDAVSWRWALLGAAGVAASGLASTPLAESPTPASQPAGLLSTELKMRAFYAYERRLRARSSPDKARGRLNCAQSALSLHSHARPSLPQIFQYFASIKNADGVFMVRRVRVSALRTARCLTKDSRPSQLPMDLLRAVVPVFPAYGSAALRAGALPGEPARTGTSVAVPACAASFFARFDVEKDGRLSYAEYIFFQTLLTIPAHEASAAFRMFDTDESGSLDAKEFCAMMRVLRAQTRQGESASGVARTGGVDNSSEAALDAACASALFFGRDGTKTLSLQRFQTFMTELHGAMVALEFAHYDVAERGYLTPADFGLSLVAGAGADDVGALLARCSTLAGAADGGAPSSQQGGDKRGRGAPAAAAPERGISHPQFATFHALLPHMSALRTAVLAYDRAHGELSKPGFASAVRRVTGLVLAPSLVDVIFQVFDTDGDGMLSPHEFLDIMSRRGAPKARRNAAASGPTNGLACCQGCVQDAWKRLTAETA